MPTPTGRPRVAGAWAAALLCAVMLTVSMLVVSLAPPAAAARAGEVEPRTVTFSAAGDFGRTKATTRTLKVIDRAGGRFHLAVGDLSYGDATERQWCRYVKRHLGKRYPMQLLAGNHESFGRDGHIDAFARCLPNRLPGKKGRYARQYYVDVPAKNPIVRVLAISPGLRYGNRTWTYERGTPRYRWTARAIDSARRAGIEWVVVGMHHPCLSMGRYGCAAGSDVVNLLVSKRVDLVLTGHEHLYQRTKQITTGPGCSRVPTEGLDVDCVADSSSLLTAGRGTVFITAGTGGTTLREVNRSNDQRGYFAAWSGKNVAPRHGIVTVTATPSRLSARFVGTTRGSFTDDVSIRR